MRSVARGFDRAGRPQGLKPGDGGVNADFGSLKAGFY